MHNDDLIFKPIIEDIAYFRNWIFATMKPVEIGLKLVFYGSGIFLVSSALKDYKHITNETIWFEN